MRFWGRDWVERGTGWYSGALLLEPLSEGGWRCRGAAIMMTRIATGATMGDALQGLLGEPKKVLGVWYYPGDSLLKDCSYYLGHNPEWPILRHDATGWICLGGAEEAGCRPTPEEAVSDYARNNYQHNWNEMVRSLKWMEHYRKMLRGS